MNCQLCQKESDAYRDGRLPGDMKVQIEDHLNTCATCSESYMIYSLAEKVIDNEKKLLSDPFLGNRIMTKIEKYENSGYKAVPEFRKVLRPLVIAASLAAAILSGILIGNIYKPDTERRQFLLNWPILMIPLSNRLINSQFSKYREMISENKNRWMVWAIIALAVMNISTILTIVYQQRKSANADAISMPAQFQSEDPSMKYSGRYFRDQLGLSREQMTGFMQFNPGFRQKMMSINVALGRVRGKMLSGMSAKNSDVNELDMLSDSIGYLHSSLKKITCRYYIDIKKICNPAQQEKLKQIFVEMFKNDFQMGQPGMGSPHGRHFGRRFNN